MSHYKRLKKLEKQYTFLKLTKYIYIGIILGIGLQVFNLIPTLMLQKLVDDYIPNYQMNGIYIGIIALIALPLCSASIMLFQNVLINSKGKMMGHQLSLTIFEKLMNQPLRFYETNNSNELLSYCNKNFYAYLLFWMSDFPTAIVNIMMSAVYFIWLTSIHWSYAILLIIYIPLLKYPADKMSGEVGKHFKEIIIRNGKSSEIIGEAFKGIKTIKLNQLQRTFIHKLNTNYKKVETFWKKVVFYDNMSGIWMNQFISMLFVGLCLSLAVLFMMQNKLTMGELIIVLSISGKYFNLVHQIIYSKLNITKHEAEHAQLFDYLDLEDEPDTGVERPRTSVKIGRITLNNISFSYKEAPMLQHLNLTINCGSWIGIIGESGIGKSTILDLVSNLYNPDEGIITVTDTNGQLVMKEELYKQMAYLSQDNYIFSGSMKSNLQLVKPHVSDDEIYDILQQVGLEQVVQALPEGIDSPLGEDAITLSQGEKQRLIIAQGLLKDASIYILDEITSHLDPATETKIRTVFKKLQKENQVTILAVSHNLNFLSQADEMYELTRNDGLVKVKN